MFWWLLLLLSMSFNIARAFVMPFRFILPFVSFMRSELWQWAWPIFNDDRIDLSCCVHFFPFVFSTADQQMKPFSIRFTAKPIVDLMWWHRLNATIVFMFNCFHSWSPHNPMHSSIKMTKLSIFKKFDSGQTYDKQKTHIEMYACSFNEKSTNQFEIVYSNRLVTHGRSRTLLRK